MFEIICILVISYLVLSHFKQNFLRLKTGEIYKTKYGKEVKIIEQIKQGPFDIFISNTGVRYFSDGMRVGDVKKNSGYQLFRKL